MPVLPDQSALVISQASFLCRLLSDDGGNLSSMRAVMLAAFLVVLCGWAIVSVQSHALQPLPDSIVTLLSIVLGGKFAQKFIEPKGPAPVIGTLSTQTEASPGAASALGQPLPPLVVAPSTAGAVA